MTILDDIVAAKRRELPGQKAATPMGVLQENCLVAPATQSLAEALAGDGISLIAEVKKASPSRGLLRPDFDPVHLATTYAEAGASAVSVLTDSHFQGQLEHLSAIKGALGDRVPVLRKDFIFDPYQVYQARAAGADALLLIVAVLTPQQLTDLLALSHELSLDCLVEVHDEDELTTAVSAGAEIIGINNRDLRTFHTDLAVTARLAPQVPSGRLMVSESGISSPEDIARLQELGVDAVLVGEALVTSSDVDASVRQLLGKVPSDTRSASGS